MTNDQQRHNERGVALIMALFLLVIITVIGLAAISTSTLDQRMAGNVRGMEQRFSTAEGGTMVAPPIIDAVLDQRQVPSTYAGLVVSNETTFVNELMDITPNDSATDSTTVSPDLRTTLDSKTVTVDVDRIKTRTVAGGSIQFASGYEGIGAGAAGAGVEIFYRDNARSTDTASLQTQVNGVYRHVVK